MFYIHNTEATVPSFPSCGFNNSTGRGVLVVMIACGNFAFKWIFCIYPFSQLISLGIKAANW